MRLLARHPVAGSAVGGHRSLRLGSSLELADYREYTPGDDPRHLDWRALARLDRPYVRRFADERDRLLHILVDASASMSLDGKSSAAVRVAAALSYVALRNGDRVSLMSLHNGHPQTLGRAAGRGGLPALPRTLNLLDRWTGETDLSSAVSAWALASGARERGLVVLISDLLDPLFFPFRWEAVRRFLTTLSAAAHEVVIIQVLGPEELNPAGCIDTKSGAADLTLVDAESGERRQLIIDGHVLAAYDRRLQAWLAGWQRLCRQLGIHYALVDSGWDFAAGTLPALGRAGILS